MTPRLVLSLASLVVSILAMPTLPGLAQDADTPPERRAMQGFPTLLVSPTRLVFEGRKRSAELFLLNNSDTIGTYRLTLHDMVMRVDGSIVAVDPLGRDGGSADGMLRYAPRQVVLQPGETQVIRVLARKPSDLGDGEYRSHLNIRALPPPERGANIDPDAGGASDFSVQPIPTFAVDIPVILRHGGLEAVVSLDIAGVDPGDAARPAAALLSLNRTGARSVYGNLIVSFEPADAAPPVLLGAISGVAVYVPNQRREIAIPLTIPAGLALNEGVVRADYRSPPEAGDARLATATLTMP